ncbi:BACK [Musa troglodytarum]|uniref:BACK n=1 Tax=Musa troglodytarum TaxID=320322 RepID=A0A9E7IAE0_9LILI|nr:BACK [Musa troglodytarum]
MRDSRSTTTTMAAAMDPGPSITGGDQNFEFAFNSSNFSDRVLRIEVVAEPDDGAADAGWAGYRKRRRDDGAKEKASESANYSLELISSCEPDTEECMEYENHDEEDEPMVEELAPGVGRAGDDTENDSSNVGGSPHVLRLFSNGMKESDQRHATLESTNQRGVPVQQPPQGCGEEAALMELLSFMYSGKLSTTSPSLLLDVLMAADKFEVVSCMRHCSQLLRSLPMTTESALLYLDLPCSVSMASAVQPLTDAAKDYLAKSYRDITKFQDEMLGLPLSGIEAILSSDDLQVASEDAIYDFVLKWARAQGPTPAACPFCRQSSHRRFTERAYKYRPLKVVEFERPHPQCIVYLDLTRGECANLFPSGRVYSQAFHLGGQGFFLSAHCNLDQHSLFHCFGLFLGMQEKGSISFTVEYEFAARTKPSGEFVSKYKGFYTFTGGKAVGYRNLFGIPWTSFVAEDSLFFINGTLHLRAELTIKQPQPPSLQ